MKKVLILLMLFSSMLFAVAMGMGEGEAGSKVESFQIDLKLTLIKKDGSKVVILDGSKFLEVKSASSLDSIADAIEIVNPQEGKYVAAEYVIKHFKFKLKIKKGGVLYYTKKDETVDPLSEHWKFTTDSSKYGHLTINAVGDGEKVAIKFPKPLIIKKGSSSSIVMVNKFKKKVNYFYIGADDIDHITWAGELEEILALVPDMPKALVSFDLIYTNGVGTKRNKIYMLFDGDDKLLGAYMMRPNETDRALNGTFAIESKQIGSNSFEIIFQDAMDSLDDIYGNDNYKLSFKLDKTTKKFSDLVINLSGATSIPAGFSLVANGDATWGEVIIDD
jgi:hypothetical protein